MRHSIGPMSHADACISGDLPRALPDRVRRRRPLTCIARVSGVAKTTLDDVAREAGCARATVYRLASPASSRCSTARRRPRGRAHARRDHRRGAGPSRTTRSSDARRRRSLTDAARGSSLDHARRSRFVLAVRARAAAAVPLVRRGRRAARRGGRVSSRPRSTRSSTPSAPFVWPSGSSASASRTSAVREAADLARRPRGCAHSSRTSSSRASDRPVSQLKGSSRHEHQQGSHRPRRDQRPRGDPLDHQHRRRRGRARRRREPRRGLHVGLRAQPHAAREALREGEDVAVERHPPTSTGRSTSTRKRSCSRTRARTAASSATPST